MNYESLKILPLMSRDRKVIDGGGENELLE